MLLSLCLKDSTDGEFLVSSGRLFQMHVVEGGNGGRPYKRYIFIYGLERLHVKLKF